MTNIAKRIWRNGIVSQLSTRGLQALEVALLANDARLLQGVGVWPAPLTALESRPVEGACVIGFCGWQGEQITTVGKLDDFYGRVSRAAEEATSEAYALGLFLRWYDDAPRFEMLCEMLAEVRLALVGRAKLAA